MRFVIIFWMIVVFLLAARESHADTTATAGLACLDTANLNETVIMYQGGVVVPPGCVFIESNAEVRVIRQLRYGPVMIRVGASPNNYFIYRDLLTPPTHLVR